MRAYKVTLRSSCVVLGLFALAGFIGCVDLESDPQSGPPPEPAVGSVEQGLGSTLTLAMSSSELDSLVSDKPFKIYIHGKKLGFATHQMDMIVCNYTAGTNSRTYDVTENWNVGCKGAGPTVPPYQLIDGATDRLGPGACMSRRVTCQVTGFETSFITAKYTQL